MEPGLVHLATTKDGFRIAYRIAGSGSPLIVIPPGPHDIHSLWSFSRALLSGLARRLFLSERTVERHIADLYTKIGARNRAEATAYALHHYA